MAIPDLFSIAAFLGALFLLTPVLGSYMADALSGKRVFLSPILSPLEHLIYRACFIDEKEEMHWQKYASTLLWFSLVGFIVVLILQIVQNDLPFNPQNLENVGLALAINTAASFVTNTNWQAYSGEATLSYLVQSLGLTVQNFLSASVGIAVLLAFIRGLIRVNTKTVGNFWVDVVRTFLYVLLPLSLILAIILLSQGVVQNFSSYVPVTTLEGESKLLPMGPAASQIAIKQLGTNGGGFFGVNSAHPYENPTPISNFFEMLALLLIPSALVYMFGVITGYRKHAFTIYCVMFALFLCILGFSLWAEYANNPSISSTKALEGKEMRFSVAESILWAISTTASSNGSVNAMHDSLSPIAGGLALLQMLLQEVIFGGVGSGLYGMLLFILLTVFLAGLMVGRSPEYLGKKIEAFDMQMTVLALILPSALLLMGAGLSSVISIGLSSILNQGPHGLSEILYAWASAANNNGSAFGGLNANTNFYNLSLAFMMIVGRFGVILPVLAIAGNLANKKAVPFSQASFATDTPTFGILLTFVIIVIGALTFFPVIVLGPLVEHLLMLAGRVF